MKHSFDWSADVGDFFFKGLTINSVTSLTILCLVLAIFAIVYESMKVHSAQVRARAARERQRTSSCAPSETANLLSSSNAGLPRTTITKRFAKMFGEAFIFLLHNSLGYGLMLSVMMFNGYIFLTVVLSMGLGYFLFGHISMKINMENMQARTTNVICSPICPEDTPTTSSSSYPSTSQSSNREYHRNQLIVDDSTDSSTTATVLRRIQESHNSSACHTTNSSITDSIRL